MIKDEQDSSRYVGCFALRTLLMDENKPPYKQTVEANVHLPLLQHAMRTDLPQLQLEAIWCLTNIASDSTGLVQSLVDA